MHKLNFKDNLTFRWQECKEQFRERFWDETHQFILNEVKQIMEDMIEQEFNHLIGALPYERSLSRRSKRNGYRSRSLETPYGRIPELQIPRARAMDIRFSLFDEWQRVEDSVLEAMLQAYLLGQSASKAQEIIEGFNHSSFSRSFLGKLTRRFEGHLEAWHHRSLQKAWPYLFIDGMSVRVKEIGLKNWTVLWALGMDEEHQTEILGFLVLKTESEEGAERLLRDLVSRGLKRPQLIIRDGSKPIENAAAMVWPHTPQQSCIFHKIKACGKYLKSSKHKKAFLREASDVYLTSHNRKSLTYRLNLFKKHWRFKEPLALKSFLSDFEKTMTYLEFPKAHWSWIRTNNPMERFIEEVRSWTKRFGYFQGLGNLEIALFTYLCHKNKELVPDLIQSQIQKNTLLIA